MGLPVVLCIKFDAVSALFLDILSSTKNGCIMNKVPFKEKYKILRREIKPARFIVNRYQCIQ